MRMLYVFLFLYSMGCSAQSDPGALDVEAKAIHPKCLPNKSATTKLVTHYYVPLLEVYDDFTCNKMEGTCIYKKNGVEWLHNYGYQDQPLEDARCKNGYGNVQNCLNPCRTIAASTKHHRSGEVIFIKNLVGQRCGSRRDNTDMIHDGYVVVGDTGSQKHFNAPGRFDFFWGRCKDKSNGVCHEGALAISQAITKASYCMVWNPADPLKNEDIKVGFVTKVKREALRRDDYGAAEDFDLDKGFPGNP